MLGTGPGYQFCGRRTGAFSDLVAPRSVAGATEWRDRSRASDFSTHSLEWTTVSGCSPAPAELYSKGTVFPASSDHTCFDSEYGSVLSFPKLASFRLYTGPGCAPRGTQSDRYYSDDVVWCLQDVAHSGLILADRLCSGLYALLPGVFDTRCLEP